MGLGGVATAALPSVVRLQMVFSDRLGGSVIKTKVLHFLTSLPSPLKGEKQFDFLIERV